MDHSLCKNCKGFCCDDIGLSLSPEDLKNSYHRWLNNKTGENRPTPITMSQASIPAYIWEGIWLTYPMLVFTHKDHMHPDGEIKSVDPIFHYRCKHHDPVTSNCLIYDERPMMCRTFPDSGFCGYRKVRSKKVKACRPDWFRFGMTSGEWGKSLEQGNKPEQDGSEKAPYKEEVCPVPA